MLALDEAIQDYLRRQWSIIPIRRRDKRPLVRWDECQRRRPTQADVRRWFRAWSDAGIGIVTGAISGLVVLDVDVAHMGDVSIYRLEQEHGCLPATVECQTGGGGRHLYFTHPGGTVRSMVGLAPGVDLRADGGYVIAPPSLHASGLHYSWADGRDPGTMTIAALPEWILRRAADKPWKSGQSVAHWRRLVTEGVQVGNRNNTLASLTGHLLRQGLDPDVATELLICWNRVRCRPPLVDEEVIAVVNSIGRLHARDAEARSPWR
jgi:hypothetical protein